MQEQVRKSKRQRVPNSFYTDLNPTRTESRKSIPKGKKQGRSQQQEEDQSYNVSESQELLQGQWHNCTLPDDSQIKVQFVLQEESMQRRKIDTDKKWEESDRKKEESAKPRKKNETGSDLLLLFQQAIENVKDQPLRPKNEQNMMSAEKDSRIKLQPQSITKKRNVDDEGRIIEAKLEECVLRIKHTKLGDYEIPFQWKEKQFIENEQQIERIEEYRNKIAELGLANDIAILVQSTNQ